MTQTPQHKEGTHQPRNEQYNIIDGEKCCWRCGVSQNDVRKGYAAGCSAWGTYYGNHMYKATNLIDNLININHVTPT